MKKLTNRKNQSGQAAVEFITVVIVIFFFLLFFMSLAFTLVVSEYVDYATFMAARTYKSGVSSPNIQEQRAREVFTSYTDKIGSIARNFQLQVVNNEPDRNQTAGIVTSFDINLFYMPPMFVTGDKPPSVITLTSETHLGRDPTVQDCQGFFTEFSRQFSLNLEGTALLEQMDDNGC